MLLNTKVSRSNDLKVGDVFLLGNHYCIIDDIANAVDSRNTNYTEITYRTLLTLKTLTKRTSKQQCICLYNNGLSIVDKEMLEQSITLLRNTFESIFEASKKSQLNTTVKRRKRWTESN